MPISDENEIKRRERLERLPKVKALYIEGYTVREIAAKMGVSRRLIYKDLDLAKREWVKEFVDTGKAIAHKQLATLDVVQREAFERYRMSLKDEVAIDTGQVTVEKAGEAGEPAVNQTTRSRKKSVKKQNGDPRWFSIILHCIAERRQLLRLGDPDANQDEDGAMQTEIVEVVVSSPDEVKQIISYKQFQDFKQAAEG